MNTDAIEKAKREGIRKVFFVTSPSGWVLAEILPRVDMVMRLITDLFVEDVISSIVYRERKDIVYEYVAGLDNWIEKVSEILQGNVPLDTRMSKVNVRKKKVFYFNMQIAMDVYYSAVYCDIAHRSMMYGLRAGAVDEEEYKKNADNIFSILDNFKSDIRGMQEFIWRCRK